MIDAEQMRAEIIKTILYEHGSNLRECTRRRGIPGSSLSNIINGKLTISDTIARKFGYTRRVMYEKL